MSTTLPTDASKANSDASTDNPQQSILTDLAGVVDKFNELLDAFGAAAQLALNSANFTTEDQGSGNPDTIIPKIQVVAKSAAYTLVASDRGKVYNLTGDAWTLGVTAVATLGADWFCYVRNNGSGTITLDPDGSETINGVTTLSMIPGQSFILVCNGSSLITVGLNTNKLGQVVYVQDGAVNTGTTIIPIDDTIPQNTEGDEYMTREITPINASSKLKIEITITLSPSTSLSWLIAALFQDTTASALATSVVYMATSGGMVTITFTHYMTAGTTSPTTFKIRAGMGAAGTTTFNGSGGTRRFGGILASSIIITEILP